MTSPHSPHSVCDIVIPVHNAAHWVDWCLDEVLRHDSDRLGRILLVDDGSMPEQSELIGRIAQRSPKILLVQTPGPDHGFATACNFGAALSSSPYLLFLNTDCLLTEGCIESLLAPFEQDSNIVLSCPFSNNSPALSFPMIPGYSYVEMNRLCREAAASQTAGNHAIDACTVVGNCLMVRRDFFDKAHGFDPAWGKGYGEETDLHMKAFSQGLRGVVVLDSYVYHFGSGTFRYESEQQEIKKRNFSLFMSKWGKEYRLLAKQCAKNSPLARLKTNLQTVMRDVSPLELDVLFYLPVLNQSTGGVHAVVAICNALIRAGIRASCAVVGDLRRSGINGYQEPLLFEFLHYPTNQHFLADKKVSPRIVVSTIFSSAPVVSHYAAMRSARHLQFIQGYEAYFDSGRRFAEFVDALKFGDAVITTSRWLESMTNRHLPPGTALLRLPLGVNEFIFYPGTRRHQRSQGICPKVGATLRSAPDKGQGMVLEVLDRLIARGDVKVVLFRAPGYAIPSWWPSDRFEVVELPADQISIARNLREIDVFLDASLHEGFGLMPLEALACGCWVVCSDSGGIRDFVKNGENGFIVKEISDPEIYIKRIGECLNLPRPGFDETFLWSHSLERYVTQLSECLVSIAPHDRASWLKKIAGIHDLPLASRLYGFLLKKYMRVAPRIPRRIGMALKALFGQST